MSFFKNINFVKILTREEPIAGLEISDAAIRLALLELPKNKTAAKIKFLEQQDLPAGTVSGGHLIKPDALIAALTELLKRLPVKIHNVVVSLPMDVVYSKVFYFPLSLSGEKLANSTLLALKFQLPQPPEQTYASAENINDTNGDRVQVLAASCQKKIIDGYNMALSKAGLNVVAVEFAAMSLGRLIPPSLQTKPLLLKIPGLKSIALCIMQGGVPLFSRVLPEKYFDGMLLEEEIEKLKTFFEYEREPIRQILATEGIQLSPGFAEHPQIKIAKEPWLTCLGAALRGLLPKGQDDLLSLLPVGTKQAYEFQKAAAFSAFIRNLSIGLSLFFIAAFFSAWLFIGSMQQKTAQQLDVLNALPVPPGGQSLETRTQNFNSLVATIDNLSKSQFNWSKVIVEINSRTTAGITISQIDLNGPAEIFNLKGLAESRDDLNNYKKSLETSPSITGLLLPLTNLEQKQNIPFTVSFRLANPQTFYPHP